MKRRGDQEQDRPETAAEFQLRGPMRASKRICVTVSRDIYMAAQVAGAQQGKRMTELADELFEAYAKLRGVDPLEF